MKLMKLSLKKHQEREIIYVIMHCALNEKRFNPYYSYLMQKFCEYDRRFKMTLQFHTWDKFKLLISMTKQQVSNLASLINHIIITDCMSLSILKVRWNFNCFTHQINDIKFIINLQECWIRRNEQVNASVPQGVAFKYFYQANWCQNAGDFYEDFTTQESDAVEECSQVKIIKINQQL